MDEDGEDVEVKHSNVELKRGVSGEKERLS